MRKLKIKRKTLIYIIILSFLLILSIVTFMPNGLINIIRNAIEKEDAYSFSYKITYYDANTEIYKILITITNPEGIDSIEYPNGEQILNCNGKKKVAIDYDTEDMKDYKFKIHLSTENEKDELLHFERPRLRKGTYKKEKGLYVNTPNIEDGFQKEYTRYININEKGNLEPGNWITDAPPADWYDYKNKKWANIYVESNGISNYYVWIPRYAYKIANEYEEGNERTDIKFIDLYNKYIDPETDKETSWEELKADGYKIPEAFEFGDYGEISISGYWISKYELSELEGYVLDYNLTASATEFNVSNFKIKEEKKQQITKYTYSLNGQVQKESEQLLEHYSFTNATPNGDNVINVTALDENGEIVGSMTKKIELTEVNPPDLSGFDEDTTFYVWWDSNGNEHNETPISKQAPADWYNYTYANWANIVTRNDGLENYYVWIPRYKYSLDTTSERTSIKFIEGIGTETESGYKIPEAFWWDKNENGEQEDDEQLQGYWISKYELSSEEKEARLDAELAVSSNLIRVKDILGTLIDNAKTTEEVQTPDNGTQIVETPIELKYEYYLNGDLIDTGTNNKENYIYKDLKPNTTYTINIIVREKESDKYVGAITKKVTTKQANAPKFDGLKENMTYYVTFDENDEMKIGEQIQLDGSNIPEGWYDYSNSKWANIVVTDGEIKDGKIVDAKTTNYFVWIPRYEYRILTNRELQSTDNRRIEINFLNGTSTDVTNGYQIPEAFWWDKDEDGEQDDDEQLEGYWISKYELSETQE